MEKISTISQQKIINKLANFFDIANNFDNKVYDIFCGILTLYYLNFMMQCKGLVRQCILYFYHKVKKRYNFEMKY